MRTHYYAFYCCMPPRVIATVFNCTQLPCGTNDAHMVREALFLVASMLYSLRTLYDNLKTCGPCR
jgi:hypothetical protein